MRGAAWPTASIVVLVFLLIAGSLLPAASALPDVDRGGNLGSHEDPLLEPLIADPACDGSCKGFAQWHAWTAAVPLGILEETLRADVDARLAGSDLPKPTEVAGFEVLTDEERREAWRAWYLYSFAAAPLLEGPVRGAPDPLGDAAGAQGAAGAAAGSGIGDPRGLAGIWRLEGHGAPRQVLPAHGDGNYLVTSRGVLFFEEPSARPLWMVRPLDPVSRVETTTAGGDGVRDLVIGTYPSFAGEHASILVVDGATGEVRHRLFAGAERLQVWALTDLDGTGREGIIGFDARGNVVAADLEGNIVYREQIPGLPAPGGVYPVPLVYLAILYFRTGTLPFADIDGDGTLDFFVPSRYYVFVIAVAVFQTASVNMLSAYSGRDLERLWVVPISAGGYSFAIPLGVGDLDGDGSSDVLFYELGYVFAPVAPVFVISVESRVYSGATGTLLAREGQNVVCAFPLACVPDPLAATVSISTLTVDLEGDGREDLVRADASISYAEGWPDLQGLRIDLVGPGPLPGGPFEVRDTHEIPVPTGARTLGASWYVRDAAGGPSQVLTVLLQSLVDTAEGTRAQTDVYRLDADGLTHDTTPRLVGLVDEDGQGTRYGWVLETDRWHVLGAEVEAMDEGMRLIVSLHPLATARADGDRVPDLLLRSSFGFTWVSGRTGTIIEEIRRPVERFPAGIYMEDGRPLLYEWEYHTGARYLVSLDGTERAVFEEDFFEDSYLAGFYDFTGDGRLEMLVNEYGSWDPSDFSYIPGDVIIMDLDGNELHRFTGENGVTVQVADLLPERPGVEVLTRSSDDGVTSLRLIVVGEDTARWALGFEGSVRDIGPGFVLLAPEEHDAAAGSLVIDHLDTRKGEVVHRDVVPPLAQDAWMYLADVLRADIDGNGEIDIVFSYMSIDWSTESVAQGVQVSSPTEGEQGAAFMLSQPPTVSGSWSWFRQADLFDFVGDWDDDGVTDIVLAESGTTVVRSLATGDVLAVGPSASTPIQVVDLNGDGRAELGVLQGFRLRFLVHDAAREGLWDDDPEELRMPDVLTYEEEALNGTFEEPRGLPLPGPVLPVLLLLLCALVGRRARDVRCRRSTG